MTEQASPVFYGMSNMEHKTVPHTLEPGNFSSKIDGHHLTEFSKSEKNTIANEATSIADDTINWATNTIEAIPKEQLQKSSLKDIWDHQPAKKQFLATLGAVALANIGLSIAGRRHGMSKSDIKTLWYGTLIAPIGEEAIFRGGAIPKIVHVISDVAGIHIRPDVSRRIADGLFGLAHTTGVYRQLGVAPIKAITQTVEAAKLTKDVQEMGLARSMTTHILMNSLALSWAYLFHGSLSDIAFGYSQRGILPKGRLTNVVGSLLGLTTVAFALNIGIKGIKEMIEDKKITDTLLHARKLHNGQMNDSFTISQEKITQLLKTPSTRGYKFQAGVELAYMNAHLTIPEHMKQGVSPDDYGRNQVIQLVTSSAKNSEEAQDRAKEALHYLDAQLAAKK